MQKPADIIASLKPTAIYPRVDAVAIWLTEPLALEEFTWLKSQCGPGGIIRRREYRKFDGRAFSLRLKLHQPSTEAFSLLSNKTPHMNYGEFALDFIFKTTEELESAREALDCTIVKRHHRTQGIRFVGGKFGTRYTGPRGAPQVLVIYSDKPQKITGEINCLHVEMRISRRYLLEKMGLLSPRDLIDFDHRSYWEKMLLLMEYDPEKFGRMHSNWDRGSRRRRPLLIGNPNRANGFRYNVDRSIGNLVFRNAESAQKIIDTWGSRINVRRAFKRIPIDHLLPEKTPQK